MPRKGSTTQAQKGPASKTVRTDGTVTCTRYGRPAVKAICERLAAGELWHRICNADGLPSYTTLYTWLRKYPEFAEAYAQARDMAADLRADTALAVAEAATAATVQADRLHVGALQWHAAKAAPRRYGSKAGEDVVEEAQPRELVIRVRHFEKAYLPDGTAYTREILSLDEVKDRQP